VTSSRLSANNKKRKRKRILFVDDEPDITSLFRLSLTRAGFDMDAFNDPLLALKSFKQNEYDLLLLDIVMPKMDGYELYERLKEIDSNVKVCFITASEMHRKELRKERQCDLDRDLFLQMPLPIKRIVEEISRRIDSSSP
jgi:two-component system, OmpR family, response regulator ChvI